MVLNGFQSQTTLRFATLDLIKTDWKRYTRNLNNENIFNKETNFEIGSVNILDNENASKNQSGSLAAAIAAAEAAKYIL